MNIESITHLAAYAQYAIAPVIAPGNGHLALVVIAEDPHLSIHRSWQGSVMNVIAPQKIGHHRFPDDKALDCWEDHFDAELSPLDLSASKIADIEEIVTPLYTMVIPDQHPRLVTDDILTPMRKRHMGAKVRRLYRERDQSDGRPVVAIVPNRYCHPGSPLFEELMNPSDNLAQISYLLITQGRMD